MPLIVDLAKLGNKHQCDLPQSPNLQTKGPRRAAKAAPRSTSWSKEHWSQMSSPKVKPFVLTISTNAADPFRSLLAKWIQKWQKSEAYRWNKISLHQKVVLLGWGKGTHWFGLVSSWLLYVSIPHTSFNRSPQRLAGVPSNRSIFARFSDVLLIRMAHRLASLKFAISGLINTLANGGVDFLPCFTKVPVMLDILLLNTQELLIFCHQE